MFRFPILPIPKSFKSFARKIPATHWLAPTKQVFGDEVLVKTPNKTFTSSQWPEMYGKVVEETQISDLFQKMQNSEFLEIKPPGVKHVCIFFQIFSLTFAYSDSICFIRCVFTVTISLHCVPWNLEQICSKMTYKLKNILQF